MVVGANNFLRGVGLVGKLIGRGVD